MNELGTYKGHEVTGTRITVKGIGVGDADPVAIVPVVLQLGHPAFLAARVVTAKHHYEFEKGEDGRIEGVTLVQELICTGAIFTDEELAGADIQKMVDDIKAVEALKKGQLTMTLVDEESNVTDIHAPVKKSRAKK